MATGKSTVGRMLAASLGYRWVDTDSLIETEHGPIIEIFANDGEEAFRELERDVAAQLAGEAGLVISTGGRLMLDPANAAALGRSGRVFCLTAQPDEILRRIQQQSGRERPLLSGASAVDRIIELLIERAEAYAQFEQVLTDGRTFDEIVADLLSRLAGNPPVENGRSPAPL